MAAGVAKREKVYSGKGRGPDQPLPVGKMKIRMIRVGGGYDDVMTKAELDAFRF